MPSAKPRTGKVANPSPRSGRSMIIEDFLIDQLCVSPLNVRTNERDANAVEALAASIEARGLLFPLIVHPSDTVPADQWPEGKVGGEREAEWAALAGGRRLRALVMLIDQGRLPPSFRVACVVRDLPLAEITELSLMENLLRRELQDYEVHAAVARAIDQGASVEEVAEHIGQEISWVRRQRRLGTLAPEIFQEYSEGRLSQDQAMAYASTEDQDLQRAAFAHFRGTLALRHDAAAIRAWLKVGDRELERLLAFVGPDVYRAAGGRYELDLFADEAEARGRVVDVGLLRDQAENKLGFVRQDLRRRTGRSDLRFIAWDDRPRINGYTDDTLRLRIEEEPDGTIALPAGEVVAMLEIVDAPSKAAEARVSWWWASRKAQRDAAAADRRGAKPAKPAPTPSVIEGQGFTAYAQSESAQRARAAVKDEHGLTTEGLQAVRSVRRALLRALVVSDAQDGLTEGTLGTDYVIWAQLRQELRKDARPSNVGARGLLSPFGCPDDDAEPREAVAPHLEATAAQAVWLQAVGRIEGEPFITLADPAEALQAFVSASHDVKALAGAVLAGLALLRSANVKGWRIAAHDRLALLAGGDDDELLRDLWQPTEQFVGLFPKLKRLEFAQPFEDPVRIKALSGAKDPEITRAATALLAKACWVHPLLRFETARVLVAEEAE